MKSQLLLAVLSVAISSHAQDLTSNLKVCMPFSGNANDISGSLNNGTVSGATLTTDRFGNASSAYQFNGTSNYISIPNFAGIAPTNELTISIWAKSDITSSNCLFMLSPDDPTDRCVGCAQYSNGGSTMMIWDYGDIFSNGRMSATGIPVDVSGWHHYTYIVSQSGNKKQTYLDGVLKSNSAYTSSCNNKNFPIYIGAGNDGQNPSGSIRFHGKIDDISIYNRALTAAEVSMLHSGTNTCFSVGVKELSQFSSGIFCPTVSDGSFNYSGDLTKLINLEVYTIDGKIVKTLNEKEISENNATLKLNFGSGIYFIKLLKSDGVYTQKLIVK